MFNTASEKIPNCSYDSEAGASGRVLHLYSSVTKRFDI